MLEQMEKEEGGRQALFNFLTFRQLIRYPSHKKIERARNLVDRTQERNTARLVLSIRQNKEAEEKKKLRSGARRRTENPLKTDGIIVTAFRRARSDSHPCPALPCAAAFHHKLKRVKRGGNSFSQSKTHIN